jgi:hypothetical protein
VRDQGVRVTADASISDGLRELSLMLDCLAEKGLCHSHIALCPEHEVYRLADPIHRPVRIDPSASDLQIRLVNPPRPSRRGCETVPALDELGHVALHPTQNRRVSKRQPSPLNLC